jgi:phosphoribosyl 1,2-cyclic phosphodiesterase
MIDSELDSEPGGELKIRIVIYGCRGSIPVNGQNFQKFGGSTTCILITSDIAKSIGIIDAGTGIRTLGQEIMLDPSMREKPIVIGFTHFHWDHIQGLPFFAPAYVKGKKIALLALGRERPIDDLERVFSVQMQREYFPVQLADMGADFEFLMPNEDTHLLPLSVVTARKHQHPGSAYAYRICAREKTIVVCTDIEYGDEIDQGNIEFCKGADLLIHDAQFTPREYEQRRGWGHATYVQAIECAKRAEVKRLILTHHDPDHDDTMLETIEREAKALFPNCEMARDGLEILV